jgi:hypothetical protein
MLTAVAAVQPKTWLRLARFRKVFRPDIKLVEYALRRAVEECPYDPECWLERARVAEDLHDHATHIASLIGAVEADPSNPELVREAALHLIRYVDDRKSEIPTTRRGVYLASVRGHMERLSGRLDATGLTRLAWLFLLEGDRTHARSYAEAGRAKDPYNPHCRKLLERLEAGSGR